LEINDGNPSSGLNMKCQKYLSESSNRKSKSVGLNYYQRPSYKGEQWALPNYINSQQV